VTERIVAPTGAVAGEPFPGGVAFRGMPYARPPIGPRRFGPSEDHPGWHRTRDALRFGPAAPQAAPPLPAIQELFADVGPTDEDCLYLNVWTPAADDAARPVLMFLHGGGLVYGSGSQRVYDGARLAAEQGIVVVTCNYRLGALGGFFHLDELGGPLAESANLGILDQRSALRWVQRNVAAFGGDPTAITVVGESSGGQSAFVHLSSPETAAGIRGAVMMSPSSRRIIERDEGRLIARSYLGHLGLDPDGGEVSARRVVAMSAAQLVAAADPTFFAFVNGPVATGHPTQPMVDGRVIDRQPLEHLAAGIARHASVIVGTNTHELELTSGPEPSGAELDELCRTLGGPARAAALRAAYDPVALAALDPPGPGAVGFFHSDRMLRIGAADILEASALHQARTFSYLLGWSRTDRCVHSQGLPLWFGTLPAAGWEQALGDGPDARRASRLLRDTLGGFVRDGIPGGELGQKWLPYTATERGSLVIDRERGARVVRDVWAAQREAWGDER
jgi:para-nitrobenzyl esterase